MSKKHCDAIIIEKKREEKEKRDGKGKELKPTIAHPSQNSPNPAHPSSPGFRLHPHEPMTPTNLQPTKH